MFYKLLKLIETHTMWSNDQSKTCSSPGRLIRDQDVKQENEKIEWSEGFIRDLIFTKKIDLKPDTWAGIYILSFRIDQSEPNLVFIKQFDSRPST